ncbi:hypothetical protein LINPERHAP1_LOCUS33527 [Linum perenne]
MADLVRDYSSYSTTRRKRGFSMSQISLHKILRIIASCAPPPSVSSNQGSSCSTREAEKADLCCAKRGIEIDLNTEVVISEEKEAAVVSAGSCLDCPAAATESGEEFMAVVAEKSSDGECDPISDKDGRDFSPAVEEDSRRFEAEAEAEAIAEATNLERIVVERGTDRRLTMLIEAAELAASVNDSAPSDFDTTTAPVEIEEESGDSGSHSPALRFGGGSGTERRRKRRNKCWVVDLYRDTETAATTTAEGKRKRGGRRSQMIPSRYRDSSMEPTTPRRSSPRVNGGGVSTGAVAEPLSTGAVVGRKRKAR